MKIKIADDDGKELASLDSVGLALEGQRLIVCPADTGAYIQKAVADDIVRSFEALGIAIVVFQIPVRVWAIADATEGE